jgi:outer membrane protein insertion porin family
MLCVLFIAYPQSWAQTTAASNAVVPETAPFTEEMLSSYEGQKVSSVQIAGQPQFNSSHFTSLLAQEPGQPFSKAKVDETVSALKTYGKYKTVRIQVEPESHGIRVVFIPEPAIYFGIFQFPGAAQFPYARLLQVANYPTQTAFNAAEVESDRQSLVNFFRQEGYFHATARLTIQVDPAHKIANVSFHISLGKSAKFGSLEIQGAPTGDTEYLRRKLSSIWARMRRAAIRPGKTYHYSTLKRSQRYLQSLLEKKGYLGAQVNLRGAEYDSASNRATILFAVTPGKVTHVQISGAHLWSWTRKSLLPVYQGVGVDREAVREGRQALTSHFQAKGFFDVKVTSQLHSGKAKNTIIYRITKREKYRVASIRISGNAHIPSSRLTPQIAVQKKHFFSHGKFSQKLLNSSVSNLQAIYHSEGYSDAKIKPKVTQNGRNTKIAFTVKEGPQDIVNSLTIEGDHTFPESQFAPKGLTLGAGLPYSQARIEADRANIVAHYLQAGYLTSGFRETASEVSKAQPHHINVVYHIYEGPKVSTGAVLTLGEEHTQQRLITRDIDKMKPAYPLTESEMLIAGTKLYNHSGVFDWAQVNPKRPITTQTREDVLVKVHEAKRNEFTYGIGFEVVNRGGSLPSGTVAIPTLPPVGLPKNFSTSERTFYGPRGTVEYTRNNLFGKGESLSLTAFAGRLDQQGAAYFINPSFFWSHWKGTTSFSYQRDEENPIFSFQQELSTFEVQKPIDRSEKDILFLRYSFSQTKLTRVLIPDLVPDRDRNVQLSTLAANLTRDTRDDPFNEHNGVLRSLELDFNAKTLGSSVNFAKLTGQVAFYKEKVDHIVWADSIRIGLAQPFAGSFVPLSDKFFTGGGNSLRGFPLDGAGPQRSVEVCPNGTPGCGTLINVPEGGNELLIINSEARIPLSIKKGLGIVPFYDGGNVFPNVGFHDFLSLYSNSVGIGLRYETPVGPIRFDIGRNLNPVAGVNPTQYFVSIGQAF